LTAVSEFGNLVAILEVYNLGKGTTDKSNNGLQETTEMKNIPCLRRSALMAALLVLSLTHNTFGAAIVGIDPKTTITATMDGGTAKTGNTWYERGVNSASNTTGLVTGLINGDTDPLSTFLFRPAVGNNALMLDTATKSGTFTLGRALPLTAIALVGASGNGAGTVVPTLHFSDGTSDTLPSATVGDWFNNTNRAQTTHGRIDIGANSYNNVGADNPRVLAIDEALSLADQSKLVTSIDFAWTGGANTHTVLFGLSGDVTGIGHFTAIPLTDASFNQDVIVGLSEVPEPGTLALCGLGAAGVLACYRRRRQS
jgi:hypothetical protein